MIKNENLVNKFKTLKSNQRLSLFLSSCIKKPHKTKSIIATAKLSNKGNKNKDAKSNQTTKHVVLSESVNLTASQCINIFSLFPPLSITSSHQISSSLTSFIFAPPPFAIL